MYAVISLKGHQYIVAEGDKITVDRIDIEVGADLEVQELLAAFDEKGTKVLVGKPFVAKSSVLCNVVEHVQGDKMRVTKFKRKNRYERAIGFRPKQTVLEIKKIKLHE